MKVDKLSVSFDHELGDAVRASAGEIGQPVSAWLADAAASKLRAIALGKFLDDWESEHGAITDEELVQARLELGLGSARAA